MWGRAVEKKGYDKLLDALAQLPKNIHWHLHHVGGGELLEKLKTQANNIGITEHITWCGPLPQTDVIQLYRHSDLFILPCRVTENGDRDGLPNVLVEAQSQGLACISTPISGVPELIEDGKNGLLVPANDHSALSEAIEKLCRSPKTRNAYGLAGQNRVTKDFNYQQGIAQLKALFDNLDNA